MILFFRNKKNVVYAVKSIKTPETETIQRLEWLFSKSDYIQKKSIEGIFIGPRKEMITPWSTNAVEITQNMGISGIERIEEFILTNEVNPDFDPMLRSVYNILDQDIYTIDKIPDPVCYIENIEAYNDSEGLALSPDEIYYLNDLSIKLGRKLTDSEIFGFSQVNSEHCRHKIFNGSFIINEKEKKKSLFELIKKTTKANRNFVVSAYKDNCAFLQGPVVEQFAPGRQDLPDYFTVRDIETVISLKAETHNFPTTVEPFNGAATGTGGEIRDRIGGGKAALPLAGTAVYMTSYSRLEDDRKWEKATTPRKWLYQTPQQILTKASNGASDFGNKFGQPLICGSVLTFEHFENNRKYGYDKVIMLAGGIGFGKRKDSEKDIPEINDKIILLGGDNYRIGMGGGAVSSVATGEYNNAIELNAVQRSNPEMQKRVANAIRALAESDINPIVSVHDHGAGGHLNCLSELVEHTGGKIDLTRLPVGDPTLSAKEIIGNESQERMGLILKDKDVPLLEEISHREKAPMYVIGEITGDHKFIFENRNEGIKPIDLKLEDMFGNPPKTILKDSRLSNRFRELSYSADLLYEYLEQVLQLEAVACKDWLTNKVDRSVTGKVAKQQTCGPIQLPLNNLGISALDYPSSKGVATSIGHAPVSALIDPAKGSVLSISEALTNIIWAPLKNGLKGISLSANWMWPCKNPGEDARLYDAVQAASDFTIALGINIPTGKDSLSMTQKYNDGEVVFSPGTVIISAAAEVNDIRKTVEPVLQNIKDTVLLYIDFSKDEMKLGGSSFSQILNSPGTSTPTVSDPEYFSNAFSTIQKLIEEEQIIAGHDISAGGIITCLLEMTFSDPDTGLEIDLNQIDEDDIVKILFHENPGIIIQIKENSDALNLLQKKNIQYKIIGKPKNHREIHITKSNNIYRFDINSYRDVWYKTSYLLEKKQSNQEQAEERFRNYKKQILDFTFRSTCKEDVKNLVNKRRRIMTGIKSAIIRDKGVNGDREMAYSMYLAGFDVKDVHMTDLISGREDLEDIHFIVFVGGFSNSDVLGSAKGWAGSFLFNEKAKITLDNYFKRNDTLSLGVCNGCQLMTGLGLLTPEHENKPEMLFNDSRKFESAFLNVDVLNTNSVMLGSLAGSRLGIWVAHGEGKFSLPYEEEMYNIPLKYSYPEYPGNPNGSAYSTAAICSADGRHLAMMPHIERSVFPWNWAYYPKEREDDFVTPWIEAFVNAREWIRKRM